jgi:Ca2+-binding EF-hand superfamily protein
MISKTLKIGLFVIALCSISLVSAQERKGKKKGNPEDLFKKLDADANASLSLEEFKAPRMKDDTKETIFNERFKTLDIDANGTLSLEEFISKKELSKADRLQQSFAKRDTDANGTIDFIEYEAFMEHSKQGRGKQKQREHRKKD